MSAKRVTVATESILLGGLILLSALPARGQGRKFAPEVYELRYYGVSPPLNEITPIPPPKGVRAIPWRRIPLPPSPKLPVAQADRALQEMPGRELSINPGLNSDGIGEGAYGFTVTVAPPDTNGAVGDTQYVQWVNTSFAVFSKTPDPMSGALVLVYGPAAGNTIWSGSGAPCETNNDGDPIVLYDKAAGRWVFTQFVFSSGYYQCYAISTTSDARGPYYLYVQSLTALGDYPKLGVWPDAYYISFAMFTGGVTYAGPKACALNRTAMLAGNQATAQCFQRSTVYGILLPSDFDGTTPPPAGANNYFLSMGVNALQRWRFHVDWVTPGNSTFSTFPTSISVAPFVPTCDGVYLGTCVLQSQTKQRLDSLGDRLMHRLAYRNFLPDHESLVVTHSIKVGNSGSAVRWYEIRSPATTPTIFQQGTYSPDPGTWRWMGSIAMDKVGNIAVGYSASSRTMHPAIRFAGRVPGDTLGTLSAETSIVEGTGSQASNSRWGDYSSMTVDPVDDCTFWYTTEYLKANGTNNWNTRIASFKFSTCQ